MSETKYAGLTHTCDDAECHVPGFVKTLRRMAGPRPTSERRDAVLGEVMQDAGSHGDEGWFILGVGGYFDVDNATWQEFSDGDAPWTSEHFSLHGTVADLVGQNAALHYALIQASPVVVSDADAERLAVLAAPSPAALDRTGASE